MAPRIHNHTVEILIRNSLFAVDQNGNRSRNKIGYATKFFFHKYTSFYLFKNLYDLFANYKKCNKSVCFGLISMRKRFIKIKSVQSLEMYLFHSLSSYEMIILAALGLNPSLFAFLLCFPDCSLGLS